MLTKPLQTIPWWKTLISDVNTSSINVHHCHPSSFNFYVTSSNLQSVSGTAKISNLCTQLQLWLDQLQWDRAWLKCIIPTLTCILYSFILISGCLAEKMSSPVGAAFSCTQLAFRRRSQQRLTLDWACRLSSSSCAHGEETLGVRFDDRYSKTVSSAQEEIFAEIYKSGLPPSENCGV
jgi:hypothetical protein